MSARKAAKASGKTAGGTKNPYGYPFWEWVAREDPEYVRARQPLSELSIGEGKELSVKYREMVIIGILAFRGRKEGVLAHMRRAIDHGATKRELLEAIRGGAGRRAHLQHRRPGPDAARPGGRVQGRALGRRRG